jgi:hypothetical protein
MVLAGQANWFYNKQFPGALGACTPANVISSPYIDVSTGLQWLCSTLSGFGQWVPGWQNGEIPARNTAAVASAAGQITPSGPLFHITGTAAITGFTMPAGWEYGGFCVIPDGAFTTTTAHNIGIASTATVGRTMCFTWDQTNSKFYPSY